VFVRLTGVIVKGGQKLREIGGNNKYGCFWMDRRRKIKKKKFL